MKKFENFVLTQPDKTVYATIGGEKKTVLFLKSGDGRCWYEAQQEFSDDTVKIQYDSGGVIRAVVDKPVPERGNVYAASMLWPINASVAEIAVEDYPTELTLDGTWRFDGESVIRDADLVAERNLRLNTRSRNKLAAVVTVTIATLQAGIACDRSVDGDSDALTAWQGYLCDLRDLTTEQLQQSPVDFPLQPKPVI